MSDAAVMQEGAACLATSRAMTASLYLRDREWTLAVACTYAVNLMLCLLAPSWSPRHLTCIHTYIQTIQQVGWQGAHLAAPCWYADGTVRAITTSLTHTIAATTGAGCRCWPTDNGTDTVFGQPDTSPGFSVDCLGSLVYCLVYYSINLKREVLCFCDF